MTAPAPWETLRRSLHSECRVFRVLRNRCRHPVDLREDDFFTIDGYDWAVALALTPGGRLVAVHQWRFGSETLSWEMPAGCREPGEDPVAAAIRELREETGYAGERARLIGTCRPNPALQSNHCHFVLVEDARPLHPVEFDAHEEIHTAEISLEEAHEMASDGRMHHAIMLNALYFLHRALRGPSAFSG